jgi:sugar lactone lactonase YvrE
MKDPGTRTRAVGLVVLGGLLCSAGVRAEVHLMRPPQLLASELARPSGLAADRSALYWTESAAQRAGTGVVRELTLGDRAPATLTATECAPTDVVMTAREVVWVNRGGELSDESGGGRCEPSVVALTRKDGIVTTLAQLPLDAWSVAIDADRDVFWTTREGEVVGRAPREGQSPEAPVLLAAVPGVPQKRSLPSEAGAGVAVDADFIYWTVPAAGTVMRLPKDGGTPRRLAVGQLQPTAIALDQTHVYWLNRSGGTVMKAPKDGGKATVIASGQHVPADLAVDTRHIYWTTLEGGTVMRAPKGPGEPVALAQGQRRPEQIALDDRNVYWTVAGAANEDGPTGQVLAVPK